LSKASESSTKEKWIKTGYQLFGQVGTAALNVERLSIILALSRSSFYHHFGEIEVFENHLFKHHVSRYQKLKIHLDNCQSFNPDLLTLISHWKDEMTFQRQLLINESTPRYLQCFNDAKTITENKAYKLWSADEKVDTSPTKNFNLFQTIRDFYLIHYDQADEEEIRTTITGIQTLLHGHQIDSGV
jgi:AcrR family transcriptional regulator